MHVSFLIYDNERNRNSFPAGAAYLAAVLRKKDYKVSIYNQDIYHTSDEDVRKFYDKNPVDVIGIGFVAGYYQYRKIKSLCRELKLIKNKPRIILGGHGPTPLPELFLKVTGADVVVLGEGEAILPGVIETFASGGSLENVAGVAFRNGDDVVVNQRGVPVQDLDSLPFPAWDLFPMENYIVSTVPPMAKNARQMRVVTNRGCPFPCNFCYRMEKGVRMRSVDAVVEEVKILKSNYNLNFISFLDELFMLNKKRTLEMCERFIRENLNIKFMCQGRLNIVDEEILALMKKAGCICISYGIESGNQKILDQMEKKLNVSHIHQGLKLTIKAGIHPALNMLFGHIGDNAKSLQDSMDILFEYNTYYQIRTLRPPTPYPGSPLYYHAIEKGFLKDGEDFYKKHTNVENLVVNFTELSDDEFYRLIYEANKKLIRSYYNHKVEEAEKSFHKVYFEKDYSYRGPRF